MTIYHHQNIKKTNKHKETVHYNVTGLPPLTNYTFIVYINDSLNNTKDQDQITFSEFTLLDNKTTIMLSQYYSNL